MIVLVLSEISHFYLNCNMYWHKVLYHFCIVLLTFIFAFAVLSKICLVFRFVLICWLFLVLCDESLIIFSLYSFLMYIFQAISFHLEVWGWSCGEGLLQECRKYFVWLALSFHGCICPGFCVTDCLAFPSHDQTKTETMATGSRVLLSPNCLLCNTD